MSDLNDALDALEKAIRNEGPAPHHHRHIMARHRGEWPTLWKAIDAVLAARVPRNMVPWALVEDGDVICCPTDGQPEVISNSFDMVGGIRCVFARSDDALRRHSHKRSKLERVELLERSKSVPKGDTNG